MLTRLYADNYRCLVDFEFKPSNKQLVIGRNGSGKSAALDVLSALRDFSLLGMAFDKCLGGGTMTRWRPKVETQRFELDVQLGDSAFRYELQVEDRFLNAQRLSAVQREAVACEGKLVFLFEQGNVHLFDDQFVEHVQYPFDATRSALATVRNRQDNTRLTSFRRWLRSLLRVQINPWSMASRAEQETPEPASNMSNFASWYRHLLLDNSQAVHEALAALKQVVPELEGLDAKEAGLNVRVLVASIRNEVGGISAIPLSDLSEGQRALIALYVLLFCALPEGATLLIDEPDNFLALAEIQPWLLQLLDRVDEQHAQVIMISHHPEILNQLAAQGGVLFERPEGGATRVRAFDPADESGLTPAELIARGWESA